MERKLRLRVAVTLTALSFFAGCKSLSDLKPQTGASVYVSRPQVFTRERLLNARLQESRWLASQLDRPVQRSFQGLVDERVFGGFYERFQAGFSPLSGAAGDLALREQTQSVRRQSEIDELKHQIDLLKLQQDLAAQRAKSSQSAAQFTGTSPPPSSGELAALQKNVDDLSTQIKALKASDTTLGLGGITKPTLPEPSSAAITRAQPTNKEIFEDETAYRDLVSSRVKERQLDDTHDLSGATIYEFKFDVALAPGDSTRRYALISFQVPRPESVKPEELLFSSWTETVEHDINAESLRYQRRVQANQLSDDQFLWAYNELTTAKVQAHAPSLKEVLKALGEFIGLDPVTRANLLKDPTNTENLKLAMAKAVQSKYNKLLGKFIEVQDPAEQPIEAQRYYVMRVSPGLKGEDEFVRQVNDINDNFRPFVANIEPKEYAQNISDVAAREALTNLILSLGATLPQGLSLNNYTQYVKDSQTLLSAIKRQPLAIGYTHQGPTFGWLIGPKFTIEKGTAVFLHTAARYTFTVSLVLPAWWNWVFITGTNAWIDENGNVTAQSELWPKDWKCGPEPQIGCVKIRLPQRYSALTAALIGQSTRLSRSPELFVERTDKIVVRADSGTQSILVRGLELWRNPEVLIGSQRADKVELLPDMEGLIATFNKVSMPPRQNQSAPTVDLMVATSFGVDTLRDLVVILPPETGGEGRSFARLVSTFLEGKGDLKFTIDPTLMPRYYHSLALRVRAQGAQEWVDVPSAPRRPTATELVMPMAFDHPVGWGKPPYELVTDLRLRPSPAEDPRSILLEGRENVVYFSEIAQRSGRITPTTITFAANRVTTNSLTIDLPQNPELVFKAYPGLRQSLSGDGKVDLVLRDLQSTDLVHARLPVEAKVGPAGVGYALAVTRETLNARRDEFVPPQKDAVVEAKYKMALAFTLISGSTQEVPMAGELTVQQAANKS